ncbi:MAG: hypothetical protein ABEL51_09150 [Salinibacter sp.]
MPDPTLVDPRLDRVGFCLGPEDDGWESRQAVEKAESFFEAHETIQIQGNE